MKVLGVDPGLANCGWAVIEKTLDGQYKLISCGEIKTLYNKVDSLNLPARLKTIYSGLRKTINTYQPDVVCIETQFYSKISKNMINTYLAVGIVYLICGLLNVPIKEFSAKTIKLAVSGYGSATKAQVKKMVKLLLNCSQEIKSEHINDAVAVALCYLNTESIKHYV